jgi:FKBP-type peptidyl-prolyl cis-trans isomerase 2
MNRIAQKGDKVKIHFVARLESGHKIDMSQTNPFEIHLGKGNNILGLEEGILGMQMGEKRKIEIPVEKAYGQRQDDLLAKIPTQNLPDMGKIPEKGEIFQMDTKTGKKVFARIIDFKGEDVLLDMNHPLAGHKLIYDVVLMEIA